MERRADALVAVCQGYLDALENPDGNRRTERLTLSADVIVMYRAWLRVAGVRTAADLDRFFSDRPSLGELDRALFLEAFDGTRLTATTSTASPSPTPWSPRSPKGERWSCCSPPAPAC